MDHIKNAYGNIRVLDENIVLDAFEIYKQYKLNRMELFKLEKYIRKINKDINDNYKYGTSKLDNKYMQKRIANANKILSKYNLKISIDYI